MITYLIGHAQSENSRISSKEATEEYNDKEFGAHMCSLISLGTNKNKSKSPKI
jgi:hypothetical protein